LSRLSGLTGNVQTQINNKLNLSGGSISGILITNGFVVNFTSTFTGNVTLSSNLIFNSVGGSLVLFDGTTLSQTEFSRLSGLTGNIQSQINNKLSLSGGSITGILTTNGFVVNFTSSFTGNVTIKSNLILNDGTTLSQSELSYLDGVTSNIQTQLNLKAPINNATMTNSINLINSSDSKGFIFIPSSTLNQTNNFVASGEALISTQTVNNSSLILTTNNSSLSYGIRINSSSSTSASITAQVGSNNIVINQTNINITGLLNVSSSPTFYAPCYFSDIISMTSPISTKNKITQNIIASDVSGNSNTLKYTSVRYNTGSTSTQPVLELRDTFNNNIISFIPNIPGGGYNSINSVNDRCIVSVGPTQNVQSLTITTWNQQKNGIKISATSSTNCTTELWSNTNYVKLNSVDGVQINGVTSITYAGGNTVDSNYGTIYNASGLTTTTLTSGVDVNVSGSGISLPAGTYSISWISTFHTIGAGGNVYGYGGGYSTISTVFSDQAGLSRGYSGANIVTDQYFSVTGTTYASFASATTIYLRCYVIFGTAGTVEFNASTSALKCIKLC
jgi:hypothetical protein